MIIILRRFPFSVSMLSDTVDGVILVVGHVDWRYILLVVVTPHHHGVEEGLR